MPRSRQKPRQIRSCKKSSRYVDAPQVITLTLIRQMLPTRQFLLTNTRSTGGPDAHLTFRLPLKLLSAAIPSIGDFPYDPAQSPPQWTGPTLFLKGEHSKYINKRNIPVAKEYFPNMRLEVLDAGHWVHAEQPAETVRIIDEFLRAI